MRISDWSSDVGSSDLTLLVLSFAVLVAPLTASVMSSMDQADEGLASGINNAASRIAQLAGVALAAGVASFASGYEVGLAVAAATSLGGALPSSAERRGGKECVSTCSSRWSPVR